MSTPVILRRLAQAEFDDAADWYEQRRAGRGAAFTAAVSQVLSDISATPDAHPEAHGDIREASISGYPYAIYYRIDASANRVVVLAVFHTSRDPSIWQGRV